MLNKTTNDEKNTDLAIDQDNGSNDDYTDNTDLASLVHALYVGVQHLLVVLRREKAILAPRIICLNILRCIDLDCVFKACVSFHDALP